MDESLKNITSWIKKHKLLSLIVLFAVLIIGFFSLSFFGTSYQMASSPDMLGVSRSMEMSDSWNAPAMAEGKSGGISFEEQHSSQNADEYQIREGSVSIETDNTQRDYNEIKNNAEGYGGWVETISKSETYKTITISATLKVPSDDFDKFSEWVLNNFDVKNSNLRLYRISVERQQDEIEILQKTLDSYDNLFDKASSMELSVDGIELMDRLTQKKLYTMRQLRNYGYSVSNVQERSDYSTLRVSLTEKKEIELMPEDLGRELMSKLRESIRKITNALLDLITVPVVVFVELIVWVVYAIVIIIPLFIIGKIIIKLLKILNKKIK